MHLAIFALACLLLCQDSKGIQESPFNLINLGAMPSQRVFTVQNFANNDQDDSMMTASHLRPSQTGTTDTDRYNVCDISQILPITLTMLSSNKTVKLRAESPFLPGVSTVRGCSWSSSHSWVRPGGGCFLWLGPLGPLGPGSGESGMEWFDHIWSIDPSLDLPMAKFGHSMTVLNTIVGLPFSFQLLPGFRNLLCKMVDGPGYLAELT